jgi:hypothetical protein
MNPCGARHFFVTSGYHLREVLGNEATNRQLHII